MNIFENPTRQTNRQEKFKKQFATTYHRDNYGKFRLGNLGIINNDKDRLKFEGAHEGASVTTIYFATEGAYNNFADIPQLERDLDGIEKEISEKTKEIQDIKEEMDKNTSDTTEIAIKLQEAAIEKIQRQIKDMDKQINDKQKSIQSFFSA